MSGIIEISLRAGLGFFVLLLLTRLIGKNQLGQLNIFTYITGIAIGSMAGEIVIHRDVSRVEGVVGLFIWGVLVLGVEYIGLKNPKVRVLLDGEPAIVIKKGNIIEKTLKKQRMNIDDLTMILRTNKIFSILDVEYAILEPNGDMSVMKKQGKETVTKEDMKLPVQNGGNIPTEIIADGNVIFDNLKEFGLSEMWMNEQMRKQCISKAENVLYAELQADRQLYIQRKRGKTALTLILC